RDRAAGTGAGDRRIQRQCQSRCAAPALRGDAHDARRGVVGTGDGDQSLSAAAQRTLAGSVPRPHAAQPRRLAVGPQPAQEVLTFEAVSLALARTAGEADRPALAQIGAFALRGLVAAGAGNTE